MNSRRKFIAVLYAMYCLYLTRVYLCLENSSGCAWCLPLKMRTVLFLCFDTHPFKSQSYLSSKLDNCFKLRTLFRVGEISVVFFCLFSSVFAQYTYTTPSHAGTILILVISLLTWMSTPLYNSIYSFNIRF